VSSIPDYRQTGRLGAGASPVAAPAALSSPLLIVLLMVTLTQPYYFLVGPLVIGPYRLLLLIVAIPLLVNWVQGKYGRILLPDVLLLIYTFWIPVSMAVNGQGGIPSFFGTQFLDVFVAYVLGRAVVRNKEDFFFFAKAFLLLLLVLLPFAILESVMGKMIIQETFRGLPNLSVHRPTTLNYPPRLGLRRAMTAFDHPIIFGMLCSIGVSLALVGLKHAPKDGALPRRLGLVTGSLGGTFFSLSSGAFVSAMIQLGLMAWDRVLTLFKARWYLLTGLVIAFYVLVAAVSARPPLLVLGRMISFSGSTAWNRYMIWQFGTDEVMRHPIFGMGVFTDWVRASWMPLSVDNYWLLIAMRFGLVGIALVVGMWLVLAWRLGRRDFSRDPALSEIRKAYLFTFMGLFLALGTVAVWSTSAAMLYIFAGSAVWLLYTDGTPQTPVTTADATERQAPGARARSFTRPAAAMAAGPAKATSRRSTGSPETMAPTLPETGSAGAPGPGRDHREQRATPRYTRFPPAASKP